VVAGSGIAGVAAALTAWRHGARVTLISGTTGASALSPLLLDRPLSEDALAVVRRLGLVEETRTTRVVTLSGHTVACAAADRAYLDVQALTDRSRPAVVVVPRVDHPEWDADLLVRALSRDAWVRAHGLTFEPCDAQLLRYTEEQRMSHRSIAQRHDDPTRLAWLTAQLLRVTKPDVSAILMPPWLGTEAPLADELSRALGVGIGEAVGMPPNPSGARFVAARTRVLSELAGLECVPGFVARIERDGEGFDAVLESGARVPAEAIVLATGGIMSGGVQYTPNDAFRAAELPVYQGKTFGAGVTFVGCEVELGYDGRVLNFPASLAGDDPETLTWPRHASPPLERVGVLGGPPGLYFAGDLVADRPRSWAEALESGARAGKDAARST
jgi:anaerobic glycerol-3-phosphate dehydrogenase